MCVGEVVGATERQARHCFIKPGDVETWGLPLFEQPDAEVFAYPEMFERYAFVRGALQYVAFARRRPLAAFGVGMTDMTNLKPVSNMLMLFRDNNGLLLEATWARS